MTPDAIRQIRGGHPWVFDASIQSQSREGAAGDLAVIFDDRRKFVAVGLWDPDSTVRIMVLHHGRPRSIDGAFFAERIDAALARREDLFSSRRTTAFRCVHGENDGLGGLIVDRYEATLVIKVYSAAWLVHLPEILLALQASFEQRGVDVDRVVLRLSRRVQSLDTFGLADGDVIAGDAGSAPVVFLENGLRFEADVVAGLKTGHFLDQRENRLLVKSMSNHRRVLDVFACTGGFSLHAAAGGADSVLSVDINRRALDAAERNFALNAELPMVARCDHRTLAGDAFAVMQGLRSAGEQFDMVIIDPPSFASKQRDRPGAMAAYGRLTELGVALTRPRGLLVQSSCSSRVSAGEFRSVVIEAADATGTAFSILNETEHATDHPVGFAHGAYLTTIVGRVGEI